MSLCSVSNNGDNLIITMEPIPSQPIVDSLCTSMRQEPLLFLTDALDCFQSFLEHEHEQYDLLNMPLNCTSKASEINSVKYSSQGIQLFRHYLSYASASNCTPAVILNHMIPFFSHYLLDKVTASTKLMMKTAESFTRMLSWLSRDGYLSEINQEQKLNEVLQFIIDWQRDIDQRPCALKQWKRQQNENQIAQMTDDTNIQENGIVSLECVDKTKNGLCRPPLKDLSNYNSMNLLIW